MCGDVSFVAAKVAAAMVVVQVALDVQSSNPASPVVFEDGMGQTCHQGGCLYGGLRCPAARWFGGGCRGGVQPPGLEGWWCGEPSTTS